MSERTYRARATSVVLGESSKKGTPQVVVGLEVLTPDAPERAFTWFGFLSDATFKRTVEALRTLGWKGDDISEVEGLDQEVDIVVDDEEYEGKVRARVKWINAPGAMVTAAMEAGKAKAFAASMKDRIRALAAANGQPVKKAAPAPAAPKMSQEDVPF